MNEKILVLVRTIPEKSATYENLVCVAGINDRGEWRRLYPFEFRYGENSVNFRKKDLIEVTLANPDNDKRKESRKVTHHKNLNSHQDDDEVLKRIMPLVFSIEKLNKEKASLGVIKPEITGIDVIINSTNISDEQTYFSIAENYLEKREKVKIPIELRYQFKCKDEPECRGHNIILIDWELNELARNIMRSEKDAKIIKDKIIERFFEFMKTRDLYFFMGTHFRFGTWIIIGLFYPQKRKGIQLKFTDL
ncbi:hypothetical protein METP3_01048 [Methanosarcinales archaeon]|nr:hypothetical protein METP3_01048 [Methanosarcinales archaeon]